MAKVRLGFVGVGAMGQAAHLRNYITLPDCEVVAIAEIRPGLAQAVAQRFGIPKVYADHKAMLENEVLDGIVAIQQFQNHARIVPELLQKGVPILTEKPLTDSVEAGEQILKQAKTPLYLAYHKRSDPATTYAKRQIDEWKCTNEVGRMRYIRIAMPPGDWSCNAFASNVATDETYDAGSAPWTPYIAFVNYYIHQVNLFRFLLGEDYEVIYADPSGVTMTIRSESGVSGTLEMAAYQTTVDWQESAFVAFEKGWINLELPAPLATWPGRATVYNDQTTKVPILPHDHAMRCQAVNFLKAIRGEETPLCQAEDALKDLQLAQRYIELSAA